MSDPSTPPPPVIVPPPATPPPPATVTFDAPSAGDVTLGNGNVVTNTPIQTITGTAFLDPLTPAVGSTVTLTDFGSVPLGTATVDGSGNWSATVALQDGNNVLWAADTGGLPVMKNYYVATKPPTVSFGFVPGQKNHTVHVARATQSIAVNVVDQTQAQPTATLFDNGVAVGAGTLGTDAGSQITIPVTLQPGTNVLTLQEADAFGNVGTSHPLTFIVGKKSSGGVDPIDWANLGPSVDAFGGKARKAHALGSGVLVSLGRFIRNHAGLWNNLAGQESATAAAQDIVAQEQQQGLSPRQALLGASIQELHDVISGQSTHIAADLGTSPRVSDAIAVATLGAGVARALDDAYGTHLIQFVEHKFQQAYGGMVTKFHG